MFFVPGGDFWGLLGRTSSGVVWVYPALGILLCTRCIIHDIACVSGNKSNFARNERGMNNMGYLQDRKPDAFDA